MTLEEAKASARNDGIGEDDMTPEVLRLYQWEPATVLAGSGIDTARSDEDVKADLALLEEERQANAFPAHVGKILGRVIPAVLGKL